MQVHTYIQKALIELGLSEGEAKIYSQILQKEGIDATYLKSATKYSNAGVYKIINSLIDKKYIFPLKKGRNFVYLSAALDDVAKHFSREGRRLNRISEKLSELHQLSKKGENVDIYGDNELTDFYLNIPYSIDDFIWCVGSYEACLNFVGPEVEKQFVKMRAKKGHHADAIIFDDTEISRDLEKRNIFEKRETKIIQNGEYPIEFSYLYGDHYLNFYKDADGKVKFLHAESPALARAKHIQYQMLWKGAE